MFKFLSNNKNARWNRIATQIIVGVFIISLLSFTTNQTVTVANAQTSLIKKNPISTHFQNPIMDNGADPWVTYYKGNYYMTMTTGDNVTVWKSKSLTDISNGEKTVIWTPLGTNFNDIWAPELHFINGHWYVYFAADKNWQQFYTSNVCA